MGLGGGHPDRSGSVAPSKSCKCNAIGETSVNTLRAPQDRKACKSEKRLIRLTFSERV